MTPPIRTALFVDFDQVFSGLMRVRPEAAERFARQPEEWLRYLEQGHHDPQRDADASPTSRAILLRRCYLNPVGSIPLESLAGRQAGTRANEAFSRYRTYFTRAAFSVVDCPPLTSRGKNSADIVMVMDILDALEHRTRFDEFIILSGDADFAPVLMRLRAHDRRTAILGDVLTARAYRAASDILIRQDDFIERAMGLDAETTEPEAAAPAASAASVPASPAPLSPAEREVLLNDVAQAVALHVAAAGPAGDGMSVNALLPVYQRFPQFRPGVDGRPWFGLGNMRALLEEVLQRQRSLAVDFNQAGNWLISMLPAAATDGSGSAAPRRDEGTDLQERIIAIVREVVDASDRPVALAHLSQSIMRQIPEVQGGRWPDGLRFAELLRQSRDPNIAIMNKGPGYAFNPLRHPELLEEANEAASASLLPGHLRNIGSTVNRVSGCPLLPPASFRMLYRHLSAVLSETDGRIVPSRSYFSIAVHERCAEEMVAVPREAVSFVLAMIDSALSTPGAEGTGSAPDALAAAFLDGIRASCATAGLTLSDGEIGLLQEWLGEAPAPG